jgi:hypothetical protein
MLCATPDGIFIADDEAADDIVILVPTFGLRLIFGVAIGAGPVLGRSQLRMPSGNLGIAQLSD